METAEGLNSLMEHLRLEAAYFATQIPGDVAGLAAGLPERISALVLCVPTRLDARPFERVAPCLLMISGETGLSAETTRRAHEPFWDALAEGRLTTTRGRTSGRLTFPPKPFCPYDWGREVEWVDLSGRGKLYSQTVIHAAPAAFSREAPIRNGIVDLDEGLRVAARVFGEPSLDAAMECVVLRYADGPLFAFRAMQV